jgi:phosphatidate cytidylyltransferase
MVRKRLALGFGVSAGFLALAWLDTALAGGPIFHVLIGVILVATLLEVYALCGRHGDEPLCAAPLALLVVFVAWDYAARVRSGTWLNAPVCGEADALWAFYGPTGLAAAVGLWVLVMVHLFARDPYRWLNGAPATLFGFLYVWFAGAHVFPVRAMGIGYVLALIAAAKVGDAGAYFVGSHWGRHKLAPRTSPNKTIEGAVGGMAASVLSSLLFALIFRLEGGVGFWVLFGLIVGVAAQLGDLVGSAIKRAAGAKDSGTLLPAFGGVLDVVDSPLMAAPVAFWLLVW